MRDNERANAWLAIEAPNEPWPLLAQGASAWPFYLFWIDPYASQMSPEQWPS